MGRERRCVDASRQRGGADEYGQHRRGSDGQVTTGPQEVAEFGP
jgi:hypothetical protein